MLLERTKDFYIRVITIFIIILGLYIISTTKRQRYPDIVENKISVVITYPDKISDVIDKTVIKSIEDKIKTYTFVNKYTSKSFQGFGVIDIILDEHDGDLKDNKNKLQMIIREIPLPSGVHSVKFWEWVVNEESVLDIAVYSQSESFDDVRKIVDQLDFEILKIQGISSVEYEGYFDEKIDIVLLPEEIKKKRMREIDVVKQIQLSMISYDTAIYYKNNQKISLKIENKKLSKEELENMKILTPNGLFSLKTLARINKNYERYNRYYRVASNDAIILKVKKKKDEDLIKLVERIREKVDQFNVLYPGISIKYLKDFSLETKNRLNSIFYNILTGFLLILCVLFLFIHFKAALWVVYSMITTIFIASFFFYFMDITINAISLVGLMIVMGMLIDNSIVITENAYRYKLLGYSWRRSSRKSVSQIVRPVLSSVLTTIVAFIPLYYLEGDVGKWAKQIPVVIILILIGSLVQSLVLLPRSLGMQKMNKRYHIKDRKFMIYGKKLYERSLRLVLQFPRTVIIISIFLFFISIYYLIFLKDFVSYPDEGSFRFTITAEVKDSQRSIDTLNSIKDIENYINSIPADLMYSSFVTVGGNEGPFKFTIHCQLVPIEDRNKTSDDVIREVVSVMGKNKDIKNIVIDKEVGGLPEKKDIVLKVLGNNDEARRTVFNKVESFLVNNENIKKLYKSDYPHKITMNFIPDFKTLLMNKIDINELNDYLSYALSSKVVYASEKNGHNVYIKVNIDSGIQDLEKIVFINKDQKRYFLKDLGQFVQSDVDDVIFKENGKKMQKINIEVVDFFALTELNNQILDEFRVYIDKEDDQVEIVLDGKLVENQRIFKSIRSVGLMAFLGVFFILIITFRSFFRSLIVSLAIPYSVIGISFALFTHDMPLSFMALFGMVGLCGVVVNNSIILVSLIIDNLKNSHYNNVKTAIIHASRCRFRPILITSITTIVGLLPTAYKLGGNDYFVIPTAVVLSWGLLFSTIIVLFIIPAFYFLYYGSRKKN